MSTRDTTSDVYTDHDTNTPAERNRKVGTTKKTRHISVLGQEELLIDTISEHQK